MTLDSGHRVRAVRAHTFEPTVLTRPDPPLLAAVASRGDFDDIVDEWGAQSFPASDPPANW